MGLKRTDGFRADTVRIALTRGLSRKQVAANLGVGLSMLNKWVAARRDTEMVSDKDLDLARKNERFRRENRLLKEERGILEKGETISAIGPRTMVELVLCGTKAMRFRFIEEHRGSFPANRLCDVVGVSTSGLRIFLSRPASRRQRSDLVSLAHIKEQSRLSLTSYGPPTDDRRVEGDRFELGHRRVGR